MLKACVEIEGVKKPLLLHRFNMECLTEMKKVKSGSTGNDPEEWKTGFHQRNGKIYVPGAYLFAALKNGSVNTKAGRGTIQKAWISATNILEEEIFTDREMWKGWEDSEQKDWPTESDAPVFIDIRMVANPNTKGRNIRYRVGLGIGWKMKFHIEIDDNILSMAQVRKVIEDTGKLQGIADGRTLGNGRFEMKSCEFDKI